MKGIYKIPGTKEYYIPIPKNACTSLKRVMFRRRFGFWYPRTSKRYFGIRFPPIMHGLYPSYPPDEIKNKNTINVVLRNPEDRLVSILNNRVLYHNDLHLESLPSREIDLIELLERINSNWDCYINSYHQFGHHTLQQYCYVEKNIKFLKVLKLNDLKSENIFNIVGDRKIIIPSSQNSTRNLRYNINHIRALPLNNIWSFYERDFDLWSMYNGN